MSTPIEKKIVLAITSALLVGAMASAAYADEPRSPLTDWNITSRHSQREEEVRDAREHNRNIRRQAQSMLDLGVGTEGVLNSAGTHTTSGWNLLISVQAQWDRESAAGPRRFRGPLGYSRLMFLHINGRLAIDPNRPDSRSDAIPYIDLKLSPASLTQVESDQSMMRLFGVDFFPTSIHRDVRLGRNYRFTVSLIGIDVRHQREISRNVDFILAATSSIIGSRIQNTFTSPPSSEEDGAVSWDQTFGTQLNNTDLMMSLLFHRDNAYLGARLTLGASSSIGLITANDGSSSDPQHNVVISTDFETHAEASFRIGQFFELFSRVSLVQIRENREGPVQTRSITQFMTGASLQF